MCERPTLKQFADCVGAKFKTQVSEEQTVWMELIEATSLAPAQSLGSGEPFSLVFLADSADAMPQRIYCLRHERLGTLEMFLVPIGPNHQGMRYEAIFN